MINKSPFDVVYFDAFAPEKQPGMWEEKVFRNIHAAMSTDGVLTTYCAKGVVRRMLQAVGFKVERLPGPPRETGDTEGKERGSDKWIRNS